MSIKILCQSCGATLKVADESVGKSVRVRAAKKNSGFDASRRMASARKRRSLQTAPHSPRANRHNVRKRNRIVTMTR